MGSSSGKKHSGVNTVWVPIEYDVPLRVHSKQSSSEAFSEEVQTHLAMTETANGAFVTELVTYIPGAILENNGARIDACFIKEDWAGNSLTRYAQKNGYLYELTSNSTLASSKSASETGCIHINWYLCSVTESGATYDCEFQFSEDVGCNEGLEPAGESSDCQILDPSTDVQAVSETVSETVTDITPLRKYKKPRWRVLKGVGWALYSNESGIVVYSNNVWTWKSLEHVNIEKDGSSFGDTITPSQGIGTPSFVAGTPNIRYAGMSVNYSVTYQAVCDCPGLNQLLAPVTKNYTAEAIWAAQP